MAQVIIRNLDDAVVARLKARARMNERSLEAELRVILERQAGGGAVGEPPGGYGQAVRASKETDSIRLPARGRPVFEPFKAIRLKGKRASRALIEERR